MYIFQMKKNLEHREGLICAKIFLHSKEWIRQVNRRDFYINQGNQNNHRQSNNKILPADVASVEVVHSVAEKRAGKSAAWMELEESQTVPLEEMEVWEEVQILASVH